MTKLRPYIFRNLIWLFYSLCFVWPIRSWAQEPTPKPLKIPKHYFSSMIVLDGYRKPNRTINDTINAISKQLKSYGIKQSNLCFQFPLMTRDFKGEGADSNVIANTHLLLTGNFMSLRPTFDGLKQQHNLTKRGIGVRYIYNTGKKGVWFFDIAPFVTRDISFKSAPYLRFATTVVYSYNVNDKLNFRLGATKSFLWGNRYYLPFVGVRIGKLDGVHFSLQFPRSISLNIPIGSKTFFSLYTRPQGGMFNFANNDTLYTNKAYKTFHFTRYEINTGLRFDFRLGNHFALYASSGLSTQNEITFYSDKANSKRSKLPYKVYFYDKKLPPTLFFELGMVFKFGKTRSIYNNRNLYDAIDLNNANSQNNGNLQIPLTPKKQTKNLNLESVRDLMDYTDF